MSKIKTPQEKKRLSYEKDCRNSHRENAKSSRKNIPRSKMLSSKKVRRSASGLNRLYVCNLDADFSCEVEAVVKVKERVERLKGFRKHPDQSLKDYIEGQRDPTKRRYSRYPGPGYW